MTDSPVKLRRIFFYTGNNLIKYKKFLICKKLLMFFVSYSIIKEKGSEVSEYGRYDCTGAVYAADSGFYG